MPAPGQTRVTSGGRRREKEFHFVFPAADGRRKEGTPPFGLTIAPLPTRKRRWRLPLPLLLLCLSVISAALPGKRCLERAMSATEELRYHGDPRSIRGHG
ncbi:unnamed protein product [Lampetra fluviatilis]